MPKAWGTLFKVLKNDWKGVAGDLYDIGAQVAHDALQDGVDYLQERFREGVEMIERDYAKEPKPGTYGYVDPEAAAPLEPPEPPPLEAPGPADPGSVIELQRINNRVLTEVMHDMPEFDGQVGVLDLENEEDLQQILNVMKDKTWNDEMRNVPTTDPPYMRQGDTWLQRQTVELEEWIEPERTVTDSMQGTQVTPVEQEVYNRMQESMPDEIELLERRTVQLDGFMTNPEPTLETPFGPGASPQPFTETPFSPETDYGGLIEQKMAEVPTLADAAETLESIGWDLIPTVEEIIGGAGGLLMGGVFSVLTAEMVPLISAMIDGDWMHPGQRDQLLFKKEQLDPVLGTYYSRVAFIQDHLAKNPTYLWVNDNGWAGRVPAAKFGRHIEGARVGYAALQAGNPTITQKNLPGNTGLWFRCRLCSMEGQGVGLLDDAPGIWLFLVPGDDTVPAFGQPGFWYRVGIDGPLIPDTRKTARACIFANYKTIRNHLTSAKSTESAPVAPPDDPFFSSHGWSGDFDPNAWAGIAETFEDADGQAQKEKEQQDKKDRRARDKINRHENWVMQEAFAEVEKEKIRLDNEEAWAKFLESQKGLRTKSKILKMKKFFDEVAAADAARNTIYEESDWPFDQRRRLPEKQTLTQEDKDEDKPILPDDPPPAPPEPSPKPSTVPSKKETSSTDSSNNGIAIVVGLIIVAYLFADS